jgi:protein O-mannosyl-transferase
MAITTLVYSVSFFNGFVRDDEVIIVNNPQTLSLHNIPAVILAPDVIKPYYRPLNRVTYLLDYQIAGLNPAWYHTINIFFHVGNVLLLYMVCRRLFTDETAALVAALLFAVHPINSEAVNFISARNTILALFFSLASLLAFMRNRSQGNRMPIFSALLFLCGLLSKETAFMLIVMIVLYTVVPLPRQEDRKQEKGRLRILVPYLIAICVYFVLRAYSLHGLVGVSVPASGLLQRLSQNLTIIPQYFVLLLVPYDLTIYHTAAPHSGFLALPGAVIGVWLLILASVWMLFKAGNRSTLFGLAWFLANYALIANIIPIPADPITERFLYLPAVGIFIAIGSVLSGIEVRKYWKYYYVIAGAIIIVLSILTMQRSRDWKDEIALCTSGVTNNPASAMAHYNLGTVLRDQGRLATAVQEWQRALELDPENSDALIQMGTYHAIQGNLNRAEQYYKAALRAPSGIADPDKSMAYYNLGKIYERKGEVQLALQQYALFLKLVTFQYEEYKADAEMRVARLRINAATSPAR